MQKIIKIVYGANVLARILGGFWMPLQFPTVNYPTEKPP
jgi:hypothetical protein